MASRDKINEVVVGPLKAMASQMFRVNEPDAPYVYVRYAAEGVVERGWFDGEKTVTKDEIDAQTDGRHPAALCGEECYGCCDYWKWQST